MTRELSKHPIWLLPGFLGTISHAICSFFNRFACNLQFTDSVAKVKGSRNVMFDEIELSRVLVDLNVQAALHTR